MIEKRKRTHKVFKICGMALLGVCGAVLFAFIFGYALMYLWNWLMPDIFGLKEISYWQGFGIVILAKILFGSFGHHHGGHIHNHMKYKMKKRMSRFYDGNPEIAENYEMYCSYWEKEGSDAFRRYMEKAKNDKNDD